MRVPWRRETSKLFTASPSDLPSERKQELIYFDRCCGDEVLPNASTSSPCHPGSAHLLGRAVRRCGTMMMVISLTAAVLPPTAVVALPPFLTAVFSTDTISPVELSDSAATTTIVISLTAAVLTPASVVALPPFLTVVFVTHHCPGGTSMRGCIYGISPQRSGRGRRRPWWPTSPGRNGPVLLLGLMLRRLVLGSMVVLVVALMLLLLLLLAPVLLLKRLRLRSVVPHLPRPRPMPATFASLQAGRVADDSNLGRRQLTVPVICENVASRATTVVAVVVAAAVTRDSLSPPVQLTWRILRGIPVQCVGRSSSERTTFLIQRTRRRCRPRRLLSPTPSCCVGDGVADERNATNTDFFCRLAKSMGVLLFLSLALRSAPFLTRNLASSREPA